MVYSGSFVTYGRGAFVVTGIGMETEVGKIASLLKTTSEKRTPLQINLDQFGQKLSILILIFCAILFGISISEETISVMHSCSQSHLQLQLFRGVKFYRNDRSFFRYTEDGKRTCDHA